MPLEEYSNICFVVVPLQLSLRLIIAYILSNKGIKGKKLFRMIYFLPTLTSVLQLTIYLCLFLNLWTS